MSEIASCPSCGKRIRIKEGAASRAVRCPGCSHRFEFFSPDDEDSESEPLPAGKPKRRTARESGSTSWLAKVSRMPLSLFTALALVAFMAVLRVVDQLLDSEIPREVVALQLAMGLLVALALLSGFSLGWLWARVVSAVAVLYLSCGLVAFILAGELSGDFFLAIVIPLAIHLGILASLERPSAREFFGLKCPACKSLKTRAADFLFREAKCLECEKVWSTRR